MDSAVLAEVRQIPLAIRRQTSYVGVNITDTLTFEKLNTQLQDSVSLGRINTKENVYKFIYV